MIEPIRITNMVYCMQFIHPTDEWLDALLNSLAIYSEYDNLRVKYSLLKKLAAKTPNKDVITIIDSLHGCPGKFHNRGHP